MNRDRSRVWSGAAVVAVVAATSVIVGVRATAAPGADEATFVPTPPCRLFDTRAGQLNVGPRDTPIGQGETHVQQVTGANGDCVVPSDANAVAMNVTALKGTAPSFLTLFPADASLPVASNLNWLAGAPPTPNKVDVRLSPSGAVNIYNAFGTVEVIADVAGYYTGAGLDDLQTQLDAKADLDEVYTRDVINATHERLPSDGGVVNSNGSPSTADFSFGSWTSTRTSVGTYKITFNERVSCLSRLRPVMSVTPIGFASGIALASCDIASGNFVFFVDTRQIDTGIALDSGFHFVVVGD